MPGSRTLTALLVAGLAAAPSARTTLSAQAPDQPAPPASAAPAPSPTRLPHAAVAAATSVDAVGAWATRISTMLRDGRLDIGRVDEDTMLPGRTHERLVQRYNGLPVFGAEVVRQLSGSSVETIFGTVTTTWPRRPRRQSVPSRQPSPQPRQSARRPMRHNHRSSASCRRAAVFSWPGAWTCAARAMSGVCMSMRCQARSCGPSRSSARRRPRASSASGPACSATARRSAPITARTASKPATS